MNRIDDDSATRIRNSGNLCTKTIIDHIISDRQNLDANISVIDTPLSDHRLLELEVDIRIQRLPKMERITKAVVNYEELTRKVQNSLSAQYCNTFDRLIEIIRTAKLQSTTTKTIRIRPKNSWINATILREIRRRNLLYKYHVRDPNNREKKRLYLESKRKTAALIRETKASDMHNKINRAGNDSRKIWQVINEEMGFKRRKKQGIEKVVHRGDQFTTEAGIANCLNNFFSDSGLELERNLRPDCVRENARHIRNSIGYRTMFLNPTNETEIGSAIFSLKTGSAPGWDGITVQDMKILSDFVTPTITRLINKALEEGEFPDCLKKGIITPVYKAGNKEDPGNYRPISLLSVMSKIFERVIDSRLKDFIGSTGGFDKRQFGFQQNSSTESAITETINIINNYLDLGSYVGATMIDLRKAFDTVDHQILISDMEDLGVRGVAKKLFENYLRERTVVTRINATHSNSLTCKIGVPQGSVLGPTLYLLYIHSMRNTELEANYVVYADDTIIINSARNENDLQQKMNYSLSAYRKWALGNKLSINTEKTCYMVFKQKNKSEIDPRITIGRSELIRVSETKYLGMYIDEKLNWRRHVDEIRKKTIPLIGAMRRCHGLDIKSRNLILNAHIESRIRYNITSWSQCSRHLVKIIDRVLCKGLKTSLGLHWRTPTVSVYEISKRLDVFRLSQLEKIIYIYKLKKGLIKSNLCLEIRADIHSRNTRGRNMLNLTTARTNRKKKGLLQSGSKMFNSIPQSIATLNSIGLFKIKLKEYLISRANSLNSSTV